MKKPIILILTLLCITVHIGAQDARVNNYSLRSLLSYPYKTSVITIQKLEFKDDLQYAYNVIFTSMGLTVSGRLSVPAVSPRNIKGIVMMLRGHQRVSTYYTGKGTENASLTYLRNGWIVISPDFFGYALSSPVPLPEFMAQFYSTINAVELFKSLELAADPQKGTQAVFQYDAAVSRANRIGFPARVNKICVWGHSNGGQVAFQFLEMIQKPVDTVIWAPTGIDFPDSAGHFGRGAAWAANFKELYPARDFSFISHLDKIADGTRIRLNHGDIDTATPLVWSDALAEAIENENKRRDANGRGRIRLQYNVLEGADHNMYPINIRTSVLNNDALFWGQQ